MRAVTSRRFDMENTSGLRAIAILVGFILCPEHPVTWGSMHTFQSGDQLQSRVMNSSSTYDSQFSRENAQIDTFPQHISILPGCYIWDEYWMETGC